MAIRAGKEGGEKRQTETTREQTVVDAAANDYFTSGVFAHIMCRMTNYRRGDLPCEG